MKTKSTHILNACLMKVTRSKIMASTCFFRFLSPEDTWSVSWPELELEFWGQAGRKLITNC